MKFQLAEMGQREIFSGKELGLHSPAYIKQMTKQTNLFR